MIKAIIYDLDDLMVDSNGLHKEAHRTVLAAYQINPDEISGELKKQFLGMRIIDILKIFVKEFNLPIKAEELKNRRETIFLELVKNRLTTLPGLRESLDWSKKNNFKIALASSGTKLYIETVLNKFDLNHYFNVIVSGDEVSKGKPDPETFLLAAKKLDLPPDQCLVLEDATNGVIAAKLGGFKCLAVKNTRTAKQDLTAADKIIDSLLKINNDTINTL